MDNVMVRSRYPRHSVVSSRKKKRNVRDSDSIMDKIARQTVLCILILMVIGIIKTVNTPVTNFLSEKIKDSLVQNIEVSSIFESIDGVIKKIISGNIFDKDTAETKNNPQDAFKLEDDSVPVSTSESMNQVTEDEDLPQSEALPINGSDTKKVSTISTASDSKPAETKSTAPTVKTTDTKSTSTVQKQSTSASVAAVTSRSSANTTTTQKYSFTIPVGGVVGSPFGERTDPFTKVLKTHKGIDIEANHGDSIKAALAGEVIEAGQDPSFGNYLKIKHDNGFTTVYAHCSQLLAKKGQKIKQGDIIAKVGNTGASIGSHLHFEVWKDGKVVNPLDYVKVPQK